MDYSRIYGEFIANRREREPSIDGYFEVHHIVPRCKGGGNGSDNLIRLTAGDHFFAHLLLAKIYGGRLWGAVFLMADRSAWPDCIKARRMYAVARMKWGELERGKDGLKGAVNGNHNPTVVDWVNVDTGATATATLYDMWKLVGGNRGSWTACFSGARNTCLGWTVRGRAVNRGMKGRPAKFVNSDGRRFVGTQKQFSDALGIGPASASRVCRHGDVTLCGWRLDGTPERNPIYCKSTGKPNRLGQPSWNGKNRTNTG